MTIGEIVNFAKKWEEKKNFGGDIPIEFSYEKLNQEGKQVVIDKEPNLIVFLENLLNIDRFICFFRRNGVDDTRLLLRNILFLFKIRHNGSSFGELLSDE